MRGVSKDEATSGSLMVRDAPSSGRALRGPVGAPSPRGGGDAVDLTGANSATIRKALHAERLLFWLIASRRACGHRLVLRCAELDCRYFGGWVKPPHQKGCRDDYRFTRNQNWKRWIVLIAREGGDSPVPPVSILKSQAVAVTRARVAKRTVVPVGQAASRENLMSVSRSKELNIRRHTASMARALTWLRNPSAISAGPGSASTIASQPPASGMRGTAREPHRATRLSHFAVRH